jgi:hypothetical protein
MSIDAQTLTDALASTALRLGRFDRVNTHEPKGAIGNGVTAALWLQRVRPYARQSGLAATSAVVTFTIRMFSPMLAEPQDAIDPAMLSSLDALMNAFTGDFTLGGAVAAVDLLGQSGEALGAQAGYIDQSGKLMRVMDITVPLIINDAWEQVP